MQDVPYGYCHCGCGGLAPIAEKTRRKQGHIKGKPYRYIHGHGHRGRDMKKGPDYRPEDRGYETPCWVWQRTISPDRGYGIYHQGKAGQFMAHRVYYERFIGAPPKGYHLNHLCQVRECVNPDHLEPMTPAAHQRWHGTKITAATAWQIRFLEASTTLRQGEVADMFGISQAFVSKIRAGKAWRLT